MGHGIFCSRQRGASHRDAATPEASDESPLLQLPGFSIKKIAAFLIERASEVPD